MAAEALDAEAPLIAIPASGVLPVAGTPASPAATLYFATVHPVRESCAAVSKTFSNTERHAGAAKSCQSFHLVDSTCNCDRDAVCVDRLLTVCKK